MQVIVPVPLILCVWFASLFEDATAVSPYIILGFKMVSYGQRTAMCPKFLVLKSLTVCTSKKKGSKNGRHLHHVVWDANIQSSQNSMDISNSF